MPLNKDPYDKKCDVLSPSPVPAYFGIYTIHLRTRDVLCKLRHVFRLTDFGFRRTCALIMLSQSHYIISQWQLFSCRKKYELNTLENHDFVFF